MVFGLGKGKLALVAGEGTLPLEFIREAKEKGEDLVVFAIEGMASKDIDRIADKVYWLDIGQYKKCIFLLIKENVKKLAMVGKVHKTVIYEADDHDEELKDALKDLKNQEDYSILGEITRRLSQMGIQVINGTEYLSHLLPEKGVLSKEKPDEHIEEDITFGYEVAQKIAGMDVGQTVIVKNKCVVAVEAMEGTDEAIQRAREIAGEGCVMVKVGRPHQDLRWDVPTVGPETITKLAENQFKALAIENGKMFVAEKEKAIALADESGIVFKVL